MAKILLYDSIAGLHFAYAKGENEVPDKLAAEWVKCGLAEYIGAAKKSPIDGGRGVETAEKAISQQAKKAEKR